MLGVAYIIVERYLLKLGSEALLAKVLEGAGLDGSDPWVGPMRYPERPFMQLCASAAACLSVSNEQFLRQCAQDAVPELLHRYAEIVRLRGNVLDLIETVCTAEISQLHGLLPAAQVAAVRFRRLDEQCGQLQLQTTPELCAISHGLLQGLAAHHQFGLVLEHQHISGGCQFGLRVLSGVAE